MPSNHPTSIRPKLPPPRPSISISLAFAATSGTALFSATALGDNPTCVRFSVETIAGPRCPDGSTATTYARAVHEGVIAGEYWQCGTSLGVGFIWHLDGTFEVIPLPTGIAEMYPHDLNATTVVGRMWPNGTGPFSAFRFADGVVSALPAPPGAAWTNADAINEAGVIVGDCIINDKSQPAQWVEGVGTAIPLTGWTSGAANDVNDAGQLCGHMSVSGILGLHAFQLDGDELIDAGTLFGLTTSAGALNNHGAMVGYGSFIPPDGVGFDQRGFLWADGAFTIIEPPTGFESCIAHDINDDGWVVGNASGAPVVPPIRGFLWRDGVVALLNDLIPADAGVVIVGAVGIDANGVIAAWANDRNGNILAARLTPLPRFAGDLDCDGTVGGGDLGALLAAWGTPGTAGADLTGDGIVDAADVGALLATWGAGS